MNKISIFFASQQHCALALNRFCFSAGQHNFWKQSLKFKSFILFIPVLLVACQSVTAASATPTEPVQPAATPIADSTPEPTAVAQEPTVSPTSTPEATPPPNKGGTAVVGVVGQPETLNPITGIDATLREISPLLFETLLHIDPETAQLKPGLATSWEYSNSGEQVTFHLPANLKWSDGSPLTATDIAQSLEATRHPALRTFNDISTPDDKTLVLTFPEPDCAAVTTVGQLPLLPAEQIFEPVPTGSGPFVVSEWSEDRRTLTLSGNPHYYQPNAPLLDGMTVRFIDENEVDIVLSEGAGQFDLVGFVPPAVPAPPEFSRHTYPAPQIIYLANNYAPRNQPPLSKQVRQALLLALDREAILAEALNGDGQLLAGSLLPGHWAANTTLAPPEYNPEKAKALLQSAGLRDRNGDGWLDQNGERLEVAIRLNGKNLLHQRLGWLISSYYRDVGLFVRAESVPPDSLIDDLFTHDFQLALFNWRILPDPDQRVYWHSKENEEGLGLNFASYNNPKLDKLLEQGVIIPGCRPEERSPIYARAQETLSQDRPVDFLLAPNRHLLLRDNLGGVDAGPFAPFTWNVAMWHFK